MSSSKPAIIDCTNEADLQALYPQGATILRHQVVSDGITLAYMLVLGTVLWRRWRSGNWRAIAL